MRIGSSTMGACKAAEAEEALPKSACNARLTFADEAAEAGT